MKTKKGYENNLQATLFDRLLLEAIDEALSSLGKASRAQIYLYLKDNYNMPKKQIPTSPKDLQGALNKILGLRAKHL